MVLPQAPDWLAKRGGSISPGIRDFVAHVVVNQQPQFRLEVRPAAGQFTCVVSKTVNGQQLDDRQGKYATAEAAFAGGLEQLRTKLGW
jgi:hypothetical protein